MTHDAVHRIWRAFGPKPHRREMFQLSTDPFFVEKVPDVVGLYLNPAQGALVLCVDEESQCQAVERSQSFCPLSPGRAQRATHDYFRHGTVSLFAALNVKTGQVMADVSLVTRSATSSASSNRSTKACRLIWTCT